MWISFCYPPCPILYSSQHIKIPCFLFSWELGWATEANSAVYSGPQLAKIRDFPTCWGFDDDDDDDDDDDTPLKVVNDVITVDVFFFWNLFFCPQNNRELRSWFHDSRYEFSAFVGEWTWLSNRFSGCWFGCHQFYFPIYWVANHPNWIFFRGVALAHQPVLISTALGFKVLWVQESG